MSILAPVSNGTAQKTLDFVQLDKIREFYPSSVSHDQEMDSKPIFYDEDGVLTKVNSLLISSSLDLTVQHDSILIDSVGLVKLWLSRKVNKNSFVRITYRLHHSN